MPVELTEMFDIDPKRVDAVKNPASGFPILLMKAIDAPADPTPEPVKKETDMPETPEVTPEAPAPVVAPVDTPVEPAEKSIGELVKEEVAKAMEPLTERNKALEAEMAALKSLPIPGGPVVTVPGAQRDRSQQAHAAAEAARFRGLAKSVGDPELVRFYEVKADEAEAASRS